MELKRMQTTAGSLYCLVDDRGTIIGWIPNPVSKIVVGPGREKVYLARATPAQAPAQAAAPRVAA